MAADRNDSVPEGREAKHFANEAVASEDALRANTYAFLAALLRQPPDADMLSELAKLGSDDTEMGRALGALAAVARVCPAEQVEDEFQALFIGVGNSELNPYCSYYLTGFLYEKPLANLRATMATLGLERAESTSEPEDHIAGLCEIMCASILGRFGPPVDLATQRAFFDEHIAPWAGMFFEDLEAAESARFYIPVGTIGRLFMHIETQAFEMAA